MFSKIQGNGQNNDNYIKEIILGNKEVSTCMTRTNNRILNPTALRPPSHRGTPESRFRRSPKSCPEAISVKNGNTNPLTGTPLTWEDPKKKIPLPTILWPFLSDLMEHNMTFHFYVLTKKCPSCYPSKLPQMASMHRLFSASSNCFWFCWKWQEDTYTDTCYNCSPDVPTNDVIQVCAPTGSVVFSAGGETIHRLFRVWVHQPSLLLKYTSREKLKSKFDAMAKFSFVLLFSS